MTAFIGLLNLAFWVLVTLALIKYLFGVGVW